MEGKVNIQVTRSVKRRLDELKIHPRQSYNEVIEKILKESENK